MLLLLLLFFTMIFSFPFFFLPFFSSKKNRTSRPTRSSFWNERIQKEKKREEPAATSWASMNGKCVCVCVFGVGLWVSRSRANHCVRLEWLSL